jgi:hypothetical protein
MQIGLTAFVVALAASWSEEKSRGTDDATVPASPRKVGRRWLTISNSRQSKLVLNACGSATGHATPMVIREPTESFDMSSLLGGPAKRESPRCSYYANPACLGSESSITASIVLNHAYGSKLH